MQKIYDLEERTLQFAKDVRKLVKNLPSTSLEINDFTQLVKSSGSIGANYIEANENLPKKDFIYRLKIARKEAKESMFWLRIIKESFSDHSIFEFDALIQEASELRNILSSIIMKIAK